MKDVALLRTEQGIEEFLRGLSPERLARLARACRGPMELDEVGRWEGEGGAPEPAPVEASSRAGDIYREQVERFNEEAARALVGPAEPQQYTEIRIGDRRYFAAAGSVPPCGPEVYTCGAPRCGLGGIGTKNRWCAECGHKTVLVGRVAPVDAAGIGIAFPPDRSDP